MPDPQAGDLMDTNDVAELLGISPSALRSGRIQSPRYQDMPPPLRLVSGSPVWSRPAIEAWAAGLPQRGDRQ